MQITIYNFSKRINSTKIPSGGTVVDVVLKTPCSETNPSFTMSNAHACTYVKAFGKYYYVTSTTHITNDLINISCSIDYMATYKSNIGNTTAFIEYAADSNNTDITDDRRTDEGKISEVAISSIDTEVFTTDLTYITPILAGRGGFSTAGYSYIVASPVIVSDIIKKYGETEDLYKKTTDVSGLIGSTTALAIKSSAITQTTLGSIFNPLGVKVDIDTSVNAVSVTGRYIKKIYTLPVKYGNTSINFTCKPPFATGFLFLPFVGLVPLDLARIYIGVLPELTIDMSVDVITGDIAYKVSRGNDVLGTYTGNCSSTLPVRVATNDKSGKMINLAVTAATSTVGVAASALGKNYVGAAATAITGASQLYQGVRTLDQSTQTVVGGLSSNLAGYLGTAIKSIVIRSNLNEDMDATDAIAGRPLFKTSTIKSHSGYLKCSSASVSLSGDMQARSYINTIINGGFYYE